MSKRKTRPQFEYDAVKQQAYMNDVRRENDSFMLETGRTRKYHIVTFGCQMNEHDSEKLIGMLKYMGYEEAAIQKEADLIIYNTCCVRENAELKVHGNLGSLKSLKKKKPDLKIAVCGCMMQQPHIVEELKMRYPYVNLIFGTHNLYQFPDLLARSYASEGTLVEVWDSEGQVVEGMPVERRYTLKAYVNIMFGCNNFCSYCIVPYTRGRERSREVDDILDEIKDLVAHGTREVTLLGQNVNSFGKTLEKPITFAELIRRINTIEGLERIRFMTSHPKDISDDLLIAMSECDKVCRQLHLPVQSGSDRILKAMNRNYTRARYEEIIRRAKELMPDIAITTDIIVGFPGETEEDAAETLALVENVRYDCAFTFMYSPRKGTPASDFENQVDESTQRERFDVLLKRVNAIVMEKNLMMKGKNTEVLVEGTIKLKERAKSSKLDGKVIMTGRNSQFSTVNFPLPDSFNSPDELIGKLVEIHIDDPKSFSHYGEFIRIL